MGSQVALLFQDGRKDAEDDECPGLFSKSTNDYNVVEVKKKNQNCSNVS